MAKTVTTITPLRISFAGGGTDLADYYLQNGGAVLSSTINKYIYVTVKTHSPLFNEKYRLSYSTTEIVNSLGEGAIWITNCSGSLENGDYITTSPILGLGMKQDDDLLHNYTVAKITQDCDFRINSTKFNCVEFEWSGSTYRKAFVGCTYHCG